MMLNTEVQIKIHGRNKEYYAEVLKRDLIFGEEVTINQFELLPHSMIKVACNCDYCFKDFKRPRAYMKSLGKTFCSNECRSIDLKVNNKLYNPSIKDKFEVFCANCSKQFQVIESVFRNNKNHLCSRECYAQHRSNVYKGSNIYNYQNEIVNCAECSTTFKSYKWKIENNNNLFCSKECYWSHRKNNYYDQYLNDARNNGRSETAPERSVREFLLESGLISGTDFFQERGFLRKYYVDFYLPKWKLIIEVYGDYWHVNPNVFDIEGTDCSKKKLNDFQKNLISSKSDEIREFELREHGYDFLIIWEQEVKNGTYKEKIKKHLTL